MKRPEHNTNPVDINRIWVRTKVDSHYWSHNDQYAHNSVDATLKWIADAVKKAEANHFEDLVIQPTYMEPDADSLGHEYIELVGWRLETDAEYERRVSGNLGQLKRSKANHDGLIKYYASEDYVKRITELEALIVKLKKKEPSCH